MRRVDYDEVAAAYDARYSYRHYPETGTLLRRFMGDDPAAIAVEIGCGTGHWLRELAGSVRTLIGVDLSWGMLERARGAAPAAPLVRADAVFLPVAAASVDRLFCVNVLHHVRDDAAFIRECRRALRPGGRFVTIGLDPHTGTDRWWVYDYFPAAIAADLARYPSTERIRSLLERAGFDEVGTEVAERLVGSTPFAVARDRGSIDRRATSQLMVIDDDEYDAGLARLREEQPTLVTNLRLFATEARVPSLRDHV